MMYYGYGFFGMIWMFAFWIGFIVLIVWLVRQYEKPSESAKDILDKRLASGEITEKEYNKIKGRIQ